jgi:flagellar operon protein
VTPDPVTRVDHAAGVRPPAPAAPGRQVSPTAFRELFDAKLAAQAQPLKFSGHALERLQRRGIPLDGAALTRLTDGVNRVAAKGGRESLVLVDDTAYVVSVRNRTVITAVGREHMKEQVFTNIDSAVIA